VKKILAGAVSVAAALAVIFGAGPASADNEYKGLTFAQVQERTSNRAVISSRTGSYLPTEECIVTGNRRASFLDSSGNGNAKILVDLNCNDISAAYGHPGNSVTTPQGQKIQQRRESAAKLSENYAKALASGNESDAYCAKSAEIAANCVRVCEEARNCSAELLDYLGV
jgi:hypothetical protein